MRMHPVDSLLRLLVKIMKSLDRRQTGLDYLRPEDVRNILVVSSTAIGDTLLSTPAIRAVRERYPAARIIAHFNVKNMELFEDNPHIDGIIPYHGGYKKFLKTIRDFRKAKFDLVLIFHGNEPQATPMAYLSRARFIVKIPVSKEYGFLLSNEGTDRSKIPSGLHTVDVKLKMASLVGCRGSDSRMVLATDEEDRMFVDEYLKQRGITKNRVIVGFQVGAADTYKMWPLRNFTELGRRLLSHNEECCIVLTGSGRERKLCAAVENTIGNNAVTTAGELTLKQLRALIKAMKVLVTNDTGTMHMAIALQTKTVSLFCPTDPWGVGPAQDLHLHKVIKKDRPCEPCVTKKCREPFCMELITVDEVYEAVKEMLQ